MVPLSVGRDGPQAGRPEPLLHEPYTEIPFDDSPDGRWLAYGTDETGIAQTYVMEFANPARKWMVSAGMGSQAFWSPSGREIFFTTFFAPLRIMVTSVSLEGEIFIRTNRVNGLPWRSRPMQGRDLAASQWLRTASALRS